MKITRFETFLANAGLRNYLFLRLRTDTGLTGVGEATLEWQEKTVQTLCHEWVERRVLGRDPFDIESIIGGMIRDQYQGGATVMTASGGAIDILRKLQRFDPVWCEEPVVPESLDLLAEVKRSVQCPIAAGERLYTLADFSRLITLRAADVVQMDLVHCGGILAGKKMA